ncbi:transcriptional regulator [Bacillus pumilus]|uniref:Transcriptional regulator n=1 Tax=Bacillus pumilus TaxID=1408 RepID=A0A2A5ITV3_BACPU|nr:helix-turn-helix domain-containing protein [Bacillus pumilus]PCK20151.1 transcriptional regulator [Bacillus pumilus]
MNIVDHHFEEVQKMARSIQKPVFLINQHGRILYTSHPMMTSLEFPILRFFQSTTNLYLSMVHSKQTFSVFPIYIHEQKCDYLVIPSFIDPQDKGLSMMIEQVANDMSIARMKHHAIKQFTQRARNEWFRRWIEGAISSPQDVTRLAQTFGLSSGISYLCIVCKLDHDSSASTCYIQQQIVLDQVIDLLESALPSCPFPAFLFVKGDMGILLMEETGSWSETSDMLLSFLKQMQLLVKQHVKGTISFGVSLTGHPIADLPKGYTEALDALQAGHLSSRHEYIQFYQAKDVSDLLKLIPKIDLVTFHQLHLHPLYEPSQVDQSLLHTLSVYVETHCHISETAKRLYVHRNTVIYRLEKCEELLRISLKDPDTTLRIRLALRIQKLLKLSPYSC